MSAEAVTSVAAIAFVILVGVKVTMDPRNVIQISDCGAPVQTSAGDMKVRCSVTNNSSTPVGHFTATAVFAEPDRPVPWGKKRFRFDVAGGIMPSETVDLDLPHPNVAGLPYGEESTLSFTKTSGFKESGAGIYWSLDS